jgi:pyruvate-ferredoxin/flavodoxin oxidoreductase
MQQDSQGSHSSAASAATPFKPEPESEPEPVYQTLDGNEAVASVAYRLSDLVAIYPITPASAMGEYADDWAALQRPNLWGEIPTVVEMQSEAGAAGTVHGALQAGACVTTFTASQGLLLMLPNLFKIAGELTPFCLHVAARSVATHALSIFGDHSDVMAARGTGLALLASGSVQEAQDMAAIGHAVTLTSRIPVLHFFDGFRTSHEVAKIQTLDDDCLRALIPDAALQAHRNRRLTPDQPVIRGTSQNPDAFFQCREAINPFYTAFPDLLQATMQHFGSLTGRHYHLFDYVGHPAAERLIVVMGSAAECAHETAEWLAGLGEKVGVLKVRLFRPFAAVHFLQAIPPTVERIAVLDRTKEPGSQGEPLLTEISAAYMQAWSQGRLTHLPRICGGRYGLASREFTPAMVQAIFQELQNTPCKAEFTVGIRDDVSHLSLPFDATLDIETADIRRALFYGLGADGTVSSNKNSIKILGEESHLFAQGYFVYDSRKSGSTTVSHLRFGPRPIRSSYLIQKAGFVAIHDPGLLERMDVFEHLADGGTVLLNSTWPPGQVWDHLTVEVQQILLQRHPQLYTIDAGQVAENAGLDRRINTVMQVCFFALAGVLPATEAITRIKQSITDTWGKRGPEIVRRNLAAVDATLQHLHAVPLPAAVTATRRKRPTVGDSAPDFVKRVTALLLEGHGERLPVSAFPVDGTWPTGTSQYEKRAIAQTIPIWEPDLCVQCNRCAMICPHTALRVKVIEPDALQDKPEGFVTVPEAYTAELKGLEYRIQVAPEDCTGCGLCVEVCPAKDRTQPRRLAINMQPVEDHRQREAGFLEYFRQLPELPASRIPTDTKSLILRQPLFEFSGACAGCGETPYIRLLTQLLGDRLLIANATGCSSIYGGNLPTTPYTVAADGRGPAWNNSLFEDAAEMGLGMRLGADHLHRHALRLLNQLATHLPAALVSSLQTHCASSDEAAIEQRRRDILALRKHLAGLALPNHLTGLPQGALELDALADELGPRSVWVIGGDGWAYDIGYGGLDHVLATGHPVKMLVLDTEVYSNTGGQQSKATPLGATAKFAAAGKAIAKKDLGLLAMSYGHVYVAQIALQSHHNHAAQALLEAERYPGPALVIAHCPCIAHGYDLVHSPRQQRQAVDSWAWPIYRFDPRRLHEGKPPLQLDHARQSRSIKEYMAEEARFRMVALRDPERYETLLKAATQATEEHRSLYLQLAKIHLDPPADITLNKPVEGAPS